MQTADRSLRAHRVGHRHLTPNTPQVHLVILVVPRVWHARPLAMGARPSVEELAHDVGVTGVASGVEQHRQEHPAQRDVDAEVVASDGVGVEIGNRSAAAVAALNGHDLLGGLVGFGVHVAELAQCDVLVRLPRQWRPLAPERITEVRALDAGEMFHEAQQIRAGPGQGPAKVRFVEPLELPQQRISMQPEVQVQQCLLVTGGHRRRVEIEEAHRAHLLSRHCLPRSRARTSERRGPAAHSGNMGAWSIHRNCGRRSTSWPSATCRPVRRRGHARARGTTWCRCSCPTAL